MSTYITYLIWCQISPPIIKCRTPENNILIICVLYMSVLGRPQEVSGASGSVWMSGMVQRHPIEKILVSKGIRKVQWEF